MPKPIKSKGVTDYTTADPVVLSSPGPNGKSNIVGSGDDDTLYGGNGKDTIDGGQGADKLYGGNGSDSIDGGEGGGADTLYGGNGSDTLNGQDGNDTLYGENSSDSIDGGQGDDKLYGGSDNDILRSGLGTDSLEGGAGNDIFDYRIYDDWNPDDRIMDLYLNFNTNSLSDQSISLNGDVIEFSYATLSQRSSFTSLANTTTPTSLSTGSTLGSADYVEGNFGVSPPTPTLGTAQFLHDLDTGALYFDPDGNTSATYYSIANIGTNSIASTAFLIVL